MLPNRYNLFLTADQLTPDELRAVAIDFYLNPNYVNPNEIDEQRIILLERLREYISRDRFAKRVRDDSFLRTKRAKEIRDRYMDKIHSISANSVIPDKKKDMISRGLDPALATDEEFFQMLEREECERLARIYKLDPTQTDRVELEIISIINFTRDYMLHFSG